MACVHLLNSQPSFFYYYYIPSTQTKANLLPWTYHLTLFFFSLSFTCALPFAKCNIQGVSVNCSFKRYSDKPECTSYRRRGKNTIRHLVYNWTIYVHRSPAEWRSITLFHPSSATLIFCPALCHFSLSFSCPVKSKVHSSNSAGERKGKEKRRQKEKCSSPVHNQNQVQWVLVGLHEGEETKHAELVHQGISTG